MATSKKTPSAKVSAKSATSAPNVEITEIKADDSIISAKESTKAAVYVKTGLTGGRRFVVTVRNAGKRPTMIALHL